MKITENTTNRRAFGLVINDYSKSVELLDNGTSQQPQVQETSSVVEYSSLESIREELKELSLLKEKLIYSCRMGTDADSAQLLEELLSQLENVTLSLVLDKQSNNASLMHICAQKNKVQCMALLFNSGLSTEVKDSLDATPLHYAVASNAEDAVGFLVTSGANCNVRDAYNKSPILLAVKNRNYRIADLLTTGPNCDVHLRTTKGNTPLHVLAASGDLEGVKYLVEKCRASAQRRNMEEENVLFSALPHTHVVQYLADRLRSEGLVKLILNPNTYGRNLVHECCEKGYYHSLIATLSCVRTDDIKRDQVSALFNSVDKSGNTPLLLAVKKSHSNIVSFLCECDEVGINHGDDDACTPLNHAITLKDKPIINILTRAGASLKAENEGDDSEYLNEKHRYICGTSLRNTLIFIISAFAIICILITAFISFGFFYTATEKNIKSLREAYFETITTHTLNSLSQVTTIGTIVQSYMQNDIVDMNNYTQVRTMTWDIYYRSTKISDIFVSAFCGRADGSASGFIGSPDNSAATEFDNWEDPYFEYLWEVGNMTTGERNYSSAYTAVLDAGELFGDWYQAANTTNTQRWTASYTSSDLPDLMWVTVSVPKRDPVTNQFLAYCSFDVATASLTSFLQKTASNVEDNLIAIIERETGYLMTTSDPEVVLFKQDFLVDLIRFTGEDSNNAFLKSTLKFAKGKYGQHFERLQTNNSVTQVQNFYDSFKVQGKKKLLNIALLNNGQGIDWVVVQSMPISAFYRDFYNSIIVICCVTTLLVVMSVIISVVASFVFMRPIRDLITKANHIKMLQLETVEEALTNGLSFFTEIQSLQLAILSMNKRLQQFKSFIPDHILAVLETEANSGHYDGLKNGLDESTTRTRDSTSISESSNPFTHQKNILKNTLSSALTSTNCTVMTIQFSDWEDILELYSSSDLSETSKDLFVTLQRYIAASHGQLVLMNSRKAVIAWNTFISQNDHVIRGCKTAYKCLKAVEELHTAWRARNLPLLDITIGLSSNHSFYGNLGSDRSKFFTLIGTAYNRSESIATLNNEWGTRVLCSADVYQAAKDEFLFRPVTTFVDRKNSEVVPVFEIGEYRELHNESAEDEWQMYREAYKLYDMKMFSEASNLFALFLDKHPTDSVTKTMIQTIKQSTL